MAKSLLEFCLIGEISPNLVTLLTTYKSVALENVQTDLVQICLGLS